MRRPTTFPVLCALAKRALAEDPTVDDAELSARVKDLLVSQGWDYPRPPHMLTAAMTAARSAHAKTHGAPPPPSTEPLPLQRPLPLDTRGSPWKHIRREPGERIGKWNSIGDLVADIQAHAQRNLPGAGYPATEGEHQSLRPPVLGKGRSSRG